jgi:rhodanese-related sulfurtransferase
MNRRHLLIALGAGILAAQDPPAEKNLSADELKELLESKGDKVFFLDVREPKELEELGSVKGYVNIPLGQLESRIAEIPKGRPVITACERGARAGRAAAILRKHGYQVIGACGLRAWRDKGYPVVYPKDSAKR